VEIIFQIAADDHEILAAIGLAIVDGVLTREASTCLRG
jgi:hypothetical protein